MSDNMIFYAIAVMFVFAFLVDIGFLGTMSQSVVSTSADSSSSISIGNAVFDWWNVRSGLEQNIIVYSVLGVLGLLVVKKIVY